jgi:hypothetical protein
MALKRISQWLVAPSGRGASSAVTPLSRCRDPCRDEEYPRFAADHRNPEKRRRFVERLAREGCSERYGYER